MSSGKKLKLKEQKQEKKLSNYVGLGIDIVFRAWELSGAVYLHDPTQQLQSFLLPALFQA